jgi:predicted metal-binding membrane protein
MHGGELLSADLRDRASVKESLIGCAVLIGVAGGCWVLSAVRMEGMDAGPAGYLGATGWFMATWIAMMAAMMLPVIAPVALAPDEPGSKSAPAGKVAQSTTFIGAYLVVWTVAGLLVYELISVVRSVAGEAFAWDRAGRWTALAVLAAAAVYQLTSHKRRALVRCRQASSPGAPALGGFTAGVNCLRSSWLMMAALFALGAMSLWWMAVVAVLTAAERLPRPSGPGRLAGAGVFLALALGVAFSPTAVPGLTVPGSPAANKAMMRMSTGPGMARGGAGMSNDKRSMR